MISIDKIRRMCHKSNNIIKHHGVEIFFYKVIKFLINKSKRNARIHTYLIFLRLKYRGASPERYDILFVDPKNIVYSYPKSSTKEVPSFGIQDGDWDLTKRDMRESELCEGLRQRFENGTPWRETAYYKRAMGKLESGEKFSPLGSFEQNRTGLLNYLDYLDSLHSNIKENGFKKPADLDYGDLPKIHIDRDGEYILATGMHRVTMAKIIAVEQIPVRVGVRHKNWQSVRVALANANSINDVPKEYRKYTGHPDLIDFEANFDH